MVSATDPYGRILSFLDRDDDDDDDNNKIIAVLYSFLCQK
jgi:hypothetical protein